jgi:FkbM family methyltransferase
VGRHFDCYGEFHEEQGGMLRQLAQPGQIVLDVGANIGGHTIPLAQHVGAQGRVYAFEPQRIPFGILCANVTLNALTNVWPMWTAVGNPQGGRSGVRVPVIDPNQPSNFGGVSLVDGSTAALVESVPLVSIDRLELPGCGMMKIDVEGMEAEALRGARKTIAKYRPVMYVENDRREKSAALIRLLTDWGYACWWHVPALYNPRNYFGETENVFGNIVSVNMVCVPQERATTVSGLTQITSPDDDWRAAIQR